MRYLLIVLSLSIFSGCSKQKEQEDLNSDSKGIKSQTTYQYTFYPSGKIKTKKSIRYQYFKGDFVDSLISEENFFYNSKGLIVKVEGKDEEEYRFYNNVDSLTAKYQINSFGDTIGIEQYIYETGKIKQRLYRNLNIIFNEDDITKTDFRNYDTLFNRYDFDYQGDTLEISLHRNIQNEITSELHTTYKNRKKVKSIQYDFLGTHRFINGTIYYDNNSDFEDLDFIILNTSGGTTGFQKTILKDSVKVLGTYFAHLHTFDNLHYNTKNQLIKRVTDIPSNNKREILSYVYDSNGNLVEETHHSEKIYEIQD